MELHTPKWTLMYVDGDQINRAEKSGEMFCHPHCWVDPIMEYKGSLDFTDKVCCREDGLEKSIK